MVNDGDSLWLMILIQWIGFVGKMFTGNQSYFPMKYGAFRLKFSHNPIL